MSADTLDETTAERLLRGALLPDDAPPGYGEVARLLQSARAEVRATAPVGGDETIAAMVAAIATRASVPGRTRRRRAGVAAVASSAAVVLFGGLTAAGALPSTAQDHVSTVLAKVGIDVPAGHAHDGRGPKARSETDGTDDNGTSSGDERTTNHGDCVSEVAGEGGEQVRVVAQSDCGKPPTAGGPETEASDRGKDASSSAPGTPSRPEGVPPDHSVQNSSSGGGNGSSATAPGQEKKPE
jgi:hypothetical protein